ncbi:MAG: ABC transporter substrate-binding protein [Oscillospiraceae bacterium]|nr:ABC transporter substrate-binding protein [Oscillospiraceae bacterium]
MKKLLSVILALTLCIAIFTSCGDSGTEETESTSRVISEYTDVGEGGELFVDSLSRLHFVDFESMVSVIVCPYPNCTHTDSETCPSFGMYNHPFLYDGKLYYFVTGVSMGDDGYENYFSIYSAETDGTSRVKLKTVSDRTVNVYERIVLIGDTLYFCSEESVYDAYGTSTNQRTIYFSSYSLSSGEYSEVAEVGSYDGGEDWVYGEYNGKIYLQYSYLKGDEPTIEDIMQDDYKNADWYNYDYYMYNIETGEFSESDITNISEWSNGYLILNGDTGKTVFTPNGDEIEVGSGSYEVCGGYIFDTWSGVAIEISTGKQYSLNLDDNYSYSVVYHADDGFVLKYLDGDYCYVKIAEGELIGYELTTEATTTAVTTVSESEDEYYITSWINEDGDIEVQETYTDEDGNRHTEISFYPQSYGMTKEDLQAEYPEKTILVVAMIGNSYSVNIQNAVNEYLDSIGKDYVIFIETVDLNVIYSDYYPSNYGSVDYYSSLKALVDSGEQIDIISTDKYYYCIRDDLLLPLDSYLESTEVGQTLYSMMPENLWTSLRYNGMVYGINCNGSLSYQKCLYLNAELVDKYGYDIEKPLTEQMDILEQVVSEESSVTPVMTYSNYQTSAYIDSQVLTTGIYWDEEKKTAKSWLDNDEFVSYLEMMYSLNLEGYVREYSFFNSFFAFENTVYLPADNGDIFDLPFGTDSDRNRVYIPVYVVYDDSVSLTRDSNAVGVSKTSENQDMAFDFIATMLTDEELNNRMCYADYEDYILDNGKIEPDTHYQTAYEQFANLLLCVPTYDESSYIAETYFESLESAYISEDFDFVFDDSKVYQQCIEVRAVTCVYGKNMFNYSNLTFEEYLNEYRATLEEAGINDIIAEANRQYAEWSEAQR